MTEEDTPAHRLVTDLQAERDRIGAELLSIAYEGAAIEERTDLLEARLAWMMEERQWVDVQSSRPTSELPLGMLDNIQAKAAWLAEEAPRLLKEILANHEEDKDNVGRAIVLRDDLQRLGLSTEHQRLLQARAEDFERQAKSMERMVEAAVRASASSNAVAEPPKAGEPLSTVVLAYRDAQRADGAWTTKTEAEIIAGLNQWLRMVGDQPITRYDTEQHRKYKATLQRLPANLNKLPKYRGCSIDEVLAFGDPPAALNTVSKQLGRVSALFGWAVPHGYTDKNPALGMKIKNPMRASEERLAFSNSDLKKLFDSDEFTAAKHREPYMFWTPLIALYTGARQNEIAQLHLADFVSIDGVSVIDINDEGAGKRVKTKAARRQIPLHCELIRLGLLDRVAALQAKGETRLFPELQQRRDGYGQTVSKWFQRYRKRCGITEPRKVFHSFRHTVINNLKQAGHSMQLIESLVGHEDESITFGRYGKPFDVRAMKTLIDALAFETVTGGIPPIGSRRLQA